MITIYPFEKLGRADHGWLDARHHFSFGHYHNPDNMEIITYVRQGAITHKDNLGNHGVTNAGDVQVMSAGSGVEHSEYNLSKDGMKMYQIWIFPNKKNVTPRWEQRAFPKDFSDKLSLLVSGQPEHAAAVEAKTALFIHQDAAIWGGKMKAGATVDHAFKHQAYVLVSKGALTLDGIAMKEGDGAEVTGQKSVKISATADTELLLLDVPEMK